jgi:hypothetical protein
VLALLLALAACGTDDEPTPGPGPTETPSSSSEPTGGTIDDPAVVEPQSALLDWRDTGVDPGTRYVKGPEWEALTARDGSSVELASDGNATGIAAGRGRTISEVLMSTDFAVVVRQDKAERQASEVDVVDLATGERSDLAGPAPASGGSWALTGGDLYYPTYGDDRAYCLATNALADSNGEDGWCAPPRTGWSGLTASEHGIGMMTFDDARPVACRTANLLDASGVPQPIEGPAECAAWDVAATADGVVWSEVPKPRRQEEAHFHARAGRLARALRRLAVLRPRPTRCRRAGPADAVDARAHPPDRLRVRVCGQRLPRRTGLRGRRTDSLLVRG